MNIYAFNAPAAAKLRADLELLGHQVAGRRIAAAVAPALVQLVQANYAALGTNKRGWPSTQFWARAAKATRDVVDDAGVTITTDQIGVQQRLQGGKIAAVNAKYLAIPATAESYGHLPGEFANLKYVQFGRGQDAPRGLVATRAVASNVEKKRGGKGFKATSEQIGQVVLFWLKKEVEQAGNANVLPTEGAFLAAIDRALQRAFPAAGNLT